MGNMKQNIGKGTEVFSFFGEFYKLIGNYYIPENDEYYWSNLKDDMDKTLAKYSGCDFIKFAVGLMLVYWEWIEKVKFKGEKDLVWEIKLKRKEE